MPVEKLVRDLRLHTVCESALCPNIGECFSRGTATLLILGNICTRNCRFCGVQKGSPLPVDAEEPLNVLEAVERLDLRYVVITSVTRDDLADGGASHFAATIHGIREKRSQTSVEVLIPDFLGSTEALGAVIEARPQVINHNVETVPRLYGGVRPKADYGRSVELLYAVKERDPDIVTKSGLMVGLGETEQEITEVMSDLREAGCDLLTIGQYLQPSPGHFPVARYVHPDEFAEYAKTGSKMGFVEVASAPLVRSSFRAAELYDRAKRRMGRNAAPGSAATTGSSTR
jgi:lipoic acid synthetase